MLGIADGDALDVKNSKELGTSAGTDEPDVVLPTLGEDDKSRENADAFKSSSVTPIGSKPGSRPTTSGTVPGKGVYGGPLSEEEYEALSVDERNAYRIEHSEAVQSPSKRPRSWPWLMLWAPSSSPIKREL